MSRSVTFPTGETLALVDATPCIVVHTPPPGRYGHGPWGLQGLGAWLTRRPALAMLGWYSMSSARIAEAQAEFDFICRLDQGVASPTVGETWRGYQFGELPAVVAFSDVPARSTLLAWTEPPPGLAWFAGESPGGSRWRWCMVEPNAELDTLPDLERRPSRRETAPANPWPCDRVGFGVYVGTPQGPMRSRVIDGRLRWWPRTLGGIPAGDVLAHPHHLLPDVA